jgi:hypothetical protein
MFEGLKEGCTILDGYNIIFKEKKMINNVVVFKKIYFLRYTLITLGLPNIVLKIIICSS